MQKLYSHCFLLLPGPGRVSRHKVNWLVNQSLSFIDVLSFKWQIKKNSRFVSMTSKCFIVEAQRNVQWLVLYSPILYYLVLSAYVRLNYCSLRLDISYLHASLLFKHYRYFFLYLISNDTWLY